MSFGALTITNSGLALQAKVQAGARLVFTKAQTGSGALQGTAPAALTALITPQQTAAIDSVAKTAADKVTVRVVVENKTLVTGYYWREIGLFAQDPDVGEILYAYSNAGDQASYIPPGSSGYTQDIINLITTVANASSVTVTINNTGLNPVWADLIANGVVPCAGTGTNIITSNNPNITAYVDGMRIALDMGSSANTGAVTININSLGAKAGIMQKTDGSTTALAGGETAGITLWQYKASLNSFVLMTNSLLDGSVTTQKLKDGAVTSGKIVTGAVTADKIAADALNDDKIGSRTINDSTAPTDDSGKITTLFSWIANIIKAITGKGSWRTTPAITLEAVSGKFDASSGHAHDGTAGNGPKIGPGGLAAGAATDTVIGNRTVVDSTTMTSDAGALTTILSTLAGMVKAITGKGNWRTAPAITLETVNGKFDASAGHGHDGSAGNGPKIGPGGLAAAAATDDAIGNRTITDTTTMTTNSGALTTIIGALAGMIKAITGESTWKTSPDASIADIVTALANCFSATIDGAGAINFNTYTSEGQFAVASAAHTNGPTTGTYSGTLMVFNRLLAGVSSTAYVVFQVFFTSAGVWFRIIGGGSTPTYNRWERIYNPALGVSMAMVTDSSGNPTTSGSVSAADLIAAANMANGVTHPTFFYAD